ncbi:MULTISPECIES: hypothetical protein [unclassified Sphingomonas]|uniref:hypothetical protein n=1 Tax=unclassified Sphingomonas TaxID=196159 RepID=UPI0035A93692
MAKVVTALEQQFFYFRKLSGNRRYSITTSRISSGTKWKYRNGLAGFALDFRLIRDRYEPAANAAKSL